MLHDFKYLTFWKRQNMETIKKKMVPKYWESGRNEQKEQRRRALKLLCTSIILLDLCNYKFIKFIECTTPRVSPHVNRGLQMILMSQFRSSFVTNTSLWWEVLTTENGYYVRGPGVYGEPTSVLLFNFTEPKLLQYKLC